MPEGCAAVDLDLTSDQELLLQTTERFIESACPLTRVRELADADRNAGPDYRRQAAELGWYAFLVPEEHGGGSVSDNPVLDAAIVAKARGAGLQPGSFVGTNVVAAALAAAGNADQQSKVLEALVSGSESAAWAAAGPQGDWTPGAGVTASSRGGGFVLSGAKSFVQDADAVDWILVTTSTGDGLAQFLIAGDAPGVRVSRLDSLDLTRAFCEVRFEDAEVPASAVVGAVGDAVVAELVDRQLQLACVLTTAESV